MRLYFSLNITFHLLCIYLGLKVQKLYIAHATNLVLLKNLLLSSKKSSFMENLFNTFKEKVINTCISQIRFSVEDQSSLDCMIPTSHKEIQRYSFSYREWNSASKHPHTYKKLELKKKKIVVCLEYVKYSRSEFSFDSPSNVIWYY